MCAALLFGAAGCTASREAAEGARPAASATHADDRSSTTGASGARGATVLGAAPHDREDRLIRAMLGRVERARTLRAQRDVPGKVVSRAELLERVRAHVAREIPEEAIENEGRALQLLGFVPTEFDYLRATFALLEAQLAGYYEPADGTMYLAGDLDEENAEATLAHELVHALQDHHYDLASRSKYAPGRSDQASAFSALAEGDATSAMLDVMVAAADPQKTALDVPEELFATQASASVMTAAEGQDIPRLMKRSLVAPYVEGVRFIHALRRRGGWAEVNRAWERPPTTTEQILHPEKWVAGEEAEKVPAPTIAPLGAGFSVVDEDTFGELGVRLAFAEWVPLARAEELAAAWGGDRAVLARNGDTTALALHLRYDGADGEEAPRLATRAFETVKTGLEGKHGKSARARGTSFVCFERSDRGPLALRRAGHAIIVVAGPAEIRRGQSRSASTCAAAERWANAIAAQR
jgi:hypothetical protein